MMKLKRTIAALVALAVIAACAASLALTGDVDGDGAIGVKDAVLLCRAIGYRLTVNLFNHHTRFYPCRFSVERTFLLCHHQQRYFA